MSDEAAIGLLVGAIVFGIGTGFLEGMANTKNWTNKSVPLTLHLASAIFAALCGMAAFGLALLVTSSKGG